MTPGATLTAPAREGGRSPLPPLLVLTDRTACSRPLEEVVGRAVDGGARAVVLREKDLPVPDRQRLADRLRALLEPVGGLLVLAGGGLPSGALHLSAGEPVPVPRPALLGRSCHDRVELLRAAADGCDWTTLGPWAPTPSKPGYRPRLSPAELAELARLPGAPPAYALGGVTADNAAQCLAAGAAGVAVLGVVMRAARPERVVADLLARLGAVGPVVEPAVQPQEAP